MAEQFPVIAGLMACTRCLSVRAFTERQDFTRNDGKSWEYCADCGRTGWHYPFFAIPPAPPEDRR